MEKSKNRLRAVSAKDKEGMSRGGREEEQRPLKRGAPRKVHKHRSLRGSAWGGLRPGKDTNAAGRRHSGLLGLAGYQDSDSTADKKPLQCGAEAWPAKV